jgi:hypothetical protein
MKNKHLIEILNKFKGEQEVYLGFVTEKGEVFNFEVCNIMPTIDNKLCISLKLKEIKNV